MEGLLGGADGVELGDALGGEGVGPFPVCDGGGFSVGSFGGAAHAGDSGANGGCRGSEPCGCCEVGLGFHDWDRDGVNNEREQEGKGKKGGGGDLGGG